ncbi:uncharacterized protein LOC129919098 [Episyrphus balteatus]|uniref:uncharacterized protein LOC129919098 n=1 Tax=Episyrphus balteatus TaxID=286459 RepID=UPI0024857133|nr:uncharacterized protein LOC129919098 [Episyrphus balteatus]
MYVDGHKYWLAYKTGSVSYYRCHRHKSTKCPGRLTHENGKTKIIVEHDHAPAPNQLLVDAFRKVLTQRATDETTDLNVIYCDEATNRHADAALLYPFTSAESAMRKARRKQLPKESATKIADIVSILDGGKDLLQVNSGSQKERIYQKTISLPDATCMIFMHRKTFELLPRIDEIHMDGSFEFVCPNQPDYYLLTFHAVNGHLTAPIIYCMVTAKTKSAYAAIFAYIRQELKVIPNIIVSDFDNLVQSELAFAFPEAIIKGSWYQYTDAILNKMKQLGLQRETAKGVGASALRMLLVLPLLPPEYMVPGLEALRKWMREKSIFSSGLSSLCDYIENIWLRAVGTEKMSIFGTNRIASNHIKVFNKDLTDRIGQNPVIWTILDSIRQLATKLYVNLKRKHGKSTKSKNLTSAMRQRRNEMVAEKIVESATQLWIKTPVHLRNPLQFLQLSSHCITDSMCLANLSNIKDRNYTMATYPKTANDSNTTVTVPPSPGLKSWAMIDSNTLQVSNSSSKKIVTHSQPESNSPASEFIPTSHIPQDSYNCGDIVISDDGAGNIYPSCFAQCSSMKSCPEDRTNNEQVLQPLTSVSQTELTQEGAANEGPATQISLLKATDLSSPPPLVFLPHVKKLKNKRLLPMLSEPPPLVLISSKRQKIS